MGTGPIMTEQRRDLLGAVAVCGEKGIRSDELSRSLKAENVFKRARSAEKVGLLLSIPDGGQKRWRRWFITPAGTRAIGAACAPQDELAELVAARRMIVALNNEIARLNDIIRDGVTGAPPAWGLTPTETRLAMALASVYPRVLSIDGALERAWPNTYPTQKVIDVHVCRIRQKIRQHGARIVTHHGMGYSICEIGARMMRGC